MPAVPPHRRTAVDPRAATGAALARVIAGTLGWLLVVYVPTFAVVSLLRPSIEVAIPLVIAMSGALAMSLIFVLARRTEGVAAFGFRWPARRQIALACLLGIPLALAAAAAEHWFPSQGPFDATRWPRMALIACFGIAAPIQEELIFRGLLQSFMAQRCRLIWRLFGVDVSPAVIVVAALFASVHVGSGAAVIVVALLLGIVAGELRWRSGSLVPAIIVHSLSNFPGLLFPST